MGRSRRWGAREWADIRVKAAWLEAPRGNGFQLSGFSFRASAFGLQLSGFSFRASAFGLQLSGFSFRASAFGLQLSGFSFRALAPNIRVPASANRFATF